ncbi:MAG: hypothetical protein PHC95_14545 [Parabacteroides sp.]|nr:hypothetical protein [Parabacteroides sp.]
MNKIIFSLILAVLQIVNLSAQERPPFSDKVVNYGNPEKVIWTQFMPYAKGRIVEESEPYISSYGRSPFLPASDYDKMLVNINRITSRLRSVPCIGTPQGADIRISKVIGHYYDTDQFSDDKKDPNATLYGEIIVSVDPCIFYKGKRGNAIEMSAVLIIRINNSQIGYPEDKNAKPAQVKINPERVAAFHGHDVYWLDDNVEYAVITKKNISPFIPISQGDYYEACVKKYSHSTEVGIGFMVDRYKEKLSELSTERRKQQAVVNMEFEDFSEESAIQQPKYFITNPQLVERSRSNVIQLITVSWSKTSTDKPLRLYKGGKDGFDIRCYLLKQLHDDSKVWNEIIKLVDGLGSD